MWAGVTACRVVELTKVVDVAGVPPKLTTSPSVKPVPLTVTRVPPALGPEFGDTPPTVNVVAYVNALVNVAETGPGLVTVMLTVPAACAGDTACKVVPLTNVTVGEVTLPNDTWEPATKPTPVMVTKAPPAGSPVTGEIDVMPRALV